MSGSHEGRRRDMASSRITGVLAWNQAQPFGLLRTGDAGLTPLTGRREAATSRAGPPPPFIHSYPQVFPHPQPTHILGISEPQPLLVGGDPVRPEAEKVHVDWGLRFD